MPTRWLPRLTDREYYVEWDPHTLYFTRTTPGLEQRFMVRTFCSRWQIARSKPLTFQELLPPPDRYRSIELNELYFMPEPMLYTTTPIGANPWPEHAKDDLLAAMETYVYMGWETQYEHELDPMPIGHTPSTSYIQAVRLYEQYWNHTAHLTPYLDDVTPYLSERHRHFFDSSNMVYQFIYGPPPTI